MTFADEVTAFVFRNRDQNIFQSVWHIASIPACATRIGLAHVFITFEYCVFPASDVGNRKRHISLPAD